MTKTILAGTAMTLLACGSAGAALAWAGTSNFTFNGIPTAPFSSYGAVTSSVTTPLALVDTATGFILSGQFNIAVPAGPVSGNLLQFTIERPLAVLASSNGVYTTTTNLTGFILPPGGGTWGPSSGSVRSSFTNPAIATVSESSIPVTLVGGATTWTSLTATSTSFTYVSGGVNWVRQRFDVDGVKLAGPAGVYIVDLPIETIVTEVPAPASLAVLGLGGLMAARRRRA